MEERNYIGIVIVILVRVYEMLNTESNIQSGQKNSYLFLILNGK